MKHIAAVSQVNRECSIAADGTWKLVFMRTNPVLAQVKDVTAEHSSLS